MDKRPFRISPTEHPSKQLFVQPDAEDPIMMAPYDPTKGLVEIHWFVQIKDPNNPSIIRNEPHTMYLDPDTFAKLKTDSAGRKINPLTRQPIVSFQTISPPRQITKATKVIQRHARDYLAKKEAQRDPATVPGNYSINANRTLTYQGRIFKVPVSADWKPTREPREHIDYHFDWRTWRKTSGDEAAENQFIAYSIVSYLQRRGSKIAPGDILHIGDIHLHFYFYISPTGAVKELPLNEDGEILYIPKELMAPFYKHRETLPQFYVSAVFFYISYILHHVENILGKEYLIHQYHRDTQTIDHYDYVPSLNEVVIKRNVSVSPEIVAHLAATARTPSPTGTATGGKRATKEKHATHKGRNTNKK